jgi:hypothetical protein
VAPAIEPAAELLDERATAIPGSRRGRSLGRSLSGAIGGTVLVVGLAFGAALGPGGALGPASGPAQAGAGAGGVDVTAKSADTGSYGYTAGGDHDGAKGDDAWGEAPNATVKPVSVDGDHPDATKDPEGEPTDKPVATDKPDATEKPKATPKPTVKPDATKAPTDAIALGLAIKEYHPAMEWGSCEGLDFDYYKVVRSTNSTASWPTGEGDELITAVERGGTRKAYDKNAPHGVKAWYRVFCVRKGEDGYKVVNASGTKGIEVPEEPAPPPSPDPIELGLEVSPLDGGKVLLDWSACEVDGFAFYKVLRSTTSDDPSYLPYHDGTEVVGVVSEMGVTSLELGAPDADATAWYRVQCIGYLGDMKVLLGESAVVAVAMP